MFMENVANQNSLQKTLLDTLKYKLSTADATSRENNFLLSNTLSKELVVVAFGTPLVAGDAFAPLVVDALRETLKVPVFCYGTTENSVNGKNMEEWLDFLKVVHKNSLIISIDASLGRNVGSVVVRKDGVCPAAVKGKKKRYGDIGILGIVAEMSGDALANLMSADYNFVQNMALDTAKDISAAIEELF